MVENTVEEVATPGWTLTAPVGGDVRDSAKVPLTAADMMTAKHAILDQNIEDR